MSGIPTLCGRRTTRTRVDLRVGALGADALAFAFDFVSTFALDLLACVSAAVLVLAEASAEIVSVTFRCFFDAPKKGVISIRVLYMDPPNQRS